MTFQQFQGRALILSHCVVAGDRLSLPLLTTLASFDDYSPIDAYVLHPLSNLIFPLTNLAL